MAFSKNRIGVPLGNSNASIDLPIAAQPDGSESRETGYTTAQSTKVSQGGKPLERMFLNQILKETQGSIKDIQNTGAPPWFSQADNNGVLMNYPLGARVWHSGAEWLSTINNNNTEPGTLGASWIRTSQIMDRIFINDDVLTTSRALTVNDINKHLVLSGTSNQTFSLPLADSVPSGSMIFVKGRKDFRATFNRQGSDTINIDSGAGFTSCSCLAPESIILVSNGNQDWRLTKINPFYNATAFTAPARAANTNYTNSSPFPIRVIINVSMGGAGSSIVLSGASSHVKPFIILNSNFSIESWFYPGEVYQLSTTGTVTIVSWFEYAVTI